MAYIIDSVGQGGKNQPQDVKIIQWMLIKAQVYYGSNLFSTSHAITESGLADSVTNAAIRDVAIWCDNKGVKNTLFLTQNYILNPPWKFYAITPGDKYYEFLLRSSIKPLCTLPGYPKADFSTDPLVVQALTGKINFLTFKNLVEVKDGLTDCTGLTAQGIEAKEKLKNPKIMAFLDMLAYAEGVDRENDGIQTGFDTLGGSKGPVNKDPIQNLSVHPGKVAAGRYQAIPGTWAADAKKLGLADFTPESQQIFGAAKLISRGIVNDIEKGDIENAIEKGSPEWASLPNRVKTAANGGTPTSYHNYSRGKNAGKPQPVPFSEKGLRDFYNAAEKIYSNKK